MPTEENRDRFSWGWKSAKCPTQRLGDGGVSICHSEPWNAWNALEMLKEFCRVMCRNSMKQQHPLFKAEDTEQQGHRAIHKLPPFGKQPVGPTAAPHRNSGSQHVPTKVYSRKVAVTALNRKLKTTGSASKFCCFFLFICLECIAGSLGHYQNLWQHRPIKSCAEIVGYRQRTRQGCSKLSCRGLAKLQLVSNLFSTTDYLQHFR